MINTLFFKFFGLFVVKSKFSNKAPTSSHEKWPDHLQWKGGRYLNRSEIDILQARYKDEIKS